MKFECKSPRCVDLDLNETDKVCWRCGGIPTAAVVPIEASNDDLVYAQAKQQLDKAAHDLAFTNSPLWPFSISQANQGQSNTGVAPNPLPEFKPNSSLPVYDKVGDYTLEWLGWRSIQDCYNQKGYPLQGCWMATKLDGAIKVYKNTIEVAEFNSWAYKEGVKQDTHNSLVELLNRG